MCKTILDVFETSESMGTGRSYFLLNSSIDNRKNFLLCSLDGVDEIMTEWEKVLEE